VMTGPWRHAEPTQEVQRKRKRNEKRRNPLRSVVPDSRRFTPHGE
jgi:hypothetical protein